MEVVTLVFVEGRFTITPQQLLVAMLITKYSDYPQAANDPGRHHTPHINVILSISHRSFLTKTYNFTMT